MDRLKRMLSRLAPDEPLFPYGPGYIPEFSEDMPVSIKYWCFVTIAVNAMAAAIGSLESQNLGPTLLALIFTLFLPINILLSWRYTMKQMNRYRDHPALQVMRPIQIYMSFEWIVIPMLIGGSAIVIYCIFFASTSVGK